MKYCIIFFGLLAFQTIAGSAEDSSSWYTEVVPTRYLYDSGNIKNASARPPWGIFPSKQSADQVVAIKEGALILATGKIYFGQSFVLVNGLLLPQEGSKLVVSAGNLIGTLSPDRVCSVNCDFGNNAAPQCIQSKCMNTSGWGRINDVAASLEKAPGNTVVNNVWAATESGLKKVVFGVKDGAIEKVADVGPLTPMHAVAVSGDKTEDTTPLVVAGNHRKLFFVDYSDDLILRFEWCTDVVQKWGGVISDRITSFVFTPSSNNVQSNGDSSLYIGNPTNLDVFHNGNGSVSSYSGDEGLPFNNITSLAFSTVMVETTKAFAPQLLVGTTKGLIIRQENEDPVWRYMNGPRWLAGSTIKDIAVVGAFGPGGAPRDEKNSGDTIVVVAEEGVTWLEQRKFTLSMKAAVFENILTKRHNRLGLTSGCDLLRYGDVDGCISKDDDNNGLWSSLVVVAEYMNYLVTGNSEALATASEYFQGMVSLNEVTNKPGLMARSLCSPEEWEAKTCGYHTWIHDKEIWYNSTNPKYPGYRWKGDTSSDESTGHVFGLTAVARLSPLKDERDLASKLLTRIVLNIVENNFTLVDVTGKPTTWGKWDPENVNGFRPWSDERGVQSMQIISYITAAYSVAADARDREILEAAYLELTNRTNQYNQNLNNMKITASCDDNYSDDELTFLPLFTFFTTFESNNQTLFDKSYVEAGLERIVKIVALERSNLWNSIYLGVSGGEKNPRFEAMQNDILWNLKTWPLDLISWPVENSHRLDIIYDSAPTRVTHQSHTQSIKNVPPLPANERRQYRWNANPWDVSDGGDGMSETDPGAWLLPYWMARYYKLI